jgi:hypothetical protein
MKKPERCLLCKHRRGEHKALTLNCPMGKKTRIGWTTFNRNQVYEPPHAASHTSEEK